MFHCLRPGNIPNVRAVLFDMDGVVIDTEKLYTRFWAAAARFYGYPMSMEQALGMRSLNRKAAQAKLEEYFGPGIDLGTIRNKRIELMDAYIREYGVEPKPGIRELLAYLKRRGIPCAITSSSSQQVIRNHLGQLGLLEGFDRLCSGHDVENGKPAPDIYLHGAACLGLMPEECLAVEDSPAGITAAFRAGCHPVIIPDQDQPTGEVLEMSFARADSLKDIIDLLEMLG